MLGLCVGGGAIGRKKELGMWLADTHAIYSEESLTKPAISYVII